MPQAQYDYYVTLIGQLLNLAGLIIAGGFGIYAAAKSRMNERNLTQQRNDISAIQTNLTPPAVKGDTDGN